MRPGKIGIIMKKNIIRNNIIIELQRKGYRVYVVPEDQKMFEIMEKMDLGLILLGDAENDTFPGYIDKIKAKSSLSDIPIIAILYKNMEQTDLVNILKKGATDLLYIKNNNVWPLVNTIDKFLKDKKSEFNVDVVKVDNIQIMVVHGELDIVNCFHFKKVFEELYQKGERHFIIDIGKIGYLESVGLGSLIYINKTVIKNKGTIKFIIRSEKVLKLLQLVKLDKYFEIYNTLEELVSLPEKQSKTKVAIIDDARFMRALIRNILEEENFDVVEYANPKLALADIDSVSPDIILVDYEMPEMNGLEFIEVFKPEEKEIPTIMLTTITDINLALKSIRMGASDFLNKPFEKEELVRIMRKIIKENQLKKENERLMKELQRREKELERKNTELYSINRNIEEELEMASEIQRRLLPQELPDIDGFKFAVKYMPSQDIGGDFYDFIRMSNQKTGIAFADISGHGIPAALLATMFKVFISTYVNDIVAPAEAMEMLNDIIAASFPEGKFISVFYLIIDEKTGQINYCKAAQEPALYVKNDGTVEELVTAGQVLGLFSSNDFADLLYFEEKSLTMKSGEKIFLYTDGLIEAKNQKDEFYGLERLMRVLSESREKEIEEILDIVYQDLQDFMEGLPIADDLTLLGIAKTL